MITKAHTQTVGDAAGVGMAAYLLMAEWIGGMAALMVLGRFDPAGGGSPVAGALAHLAVAGVYGALFGILVRRLPRRVPSWLAGLAFGLALWVIAITVLLPGAASSLSAFPAVHFLIAHVMYGGVVGLMIGRRTKDDGR